MNERKWALGLGWVSLAIGVTELAFAKPLARAFGLKGTALVRGFGLREIAAGVGALTQTRKGPWIWGRIAGDVLDLATLGAVAASGGMRVRRNAALAIAAVAPVVIADVVCGQRLGLEA